MSKLRRILAALMVLCLLVGVLPSAAFAAETGTKASDELEVKDYNTFLANLKVLESYAKVYAATNPGNDVTELVLNYVRTGVERYLDGNWKTLAGEEKTDFVNYVAAMDAEKGTTVRCLRNIVVKNFILPNGDQADFGHMFGVLNIAYINTTATADLGGWAGDICDLLQYSNKSGNVPAGTMDEMADYVRENCFGVDASGAYGMDDFYADLDAYYICRQLKDGASISEVFASYFVSSLTSEQRAEYFMKHRFSALLTKEDVREAVYKAYASNIGLQVLEASRGLSELKDLRQACCYAFADYIYNLAGDTLTGEPNEDEEEKEEEEDKEDEIVFDNPYYSVFSSTDSVLAPGITQSIKYAYTADNKQIVYYLATVDVTRDDVTIMANYKDNDPGNGWGMQRVEDQANALVKNHAYKHENFSAVVAINGTGYNMSTGEPSGLLVMDGREWHPIDGNGFFAILKDGSALIGTSADYPQYKEQIKEAIAGFGCTLVIDGKINVGYTPNYYNDRASRTAIGIKADGSVVMMVMDGRQEPFSAGGSMQEIAQVMLDAGCVHAINLDGGGSTTYLSKPEGGDKLQLVSRPSDGYARSVATSLVAISTAKPSKEFDHAVITSEYDYLTVGTKLQINAIGVNNIGGAAEMPAGVTWKVSDPKIGTITADGVFTAKANGTVDVQLLMPNGTVLGSKTLNVVIPDKIFFTVDNINAVYGVKAELPVAATYKGSTVAINEEDIMFMAENELAGTFDGMNFIGSESSGIRVTTVYAILLSNDELYTTVRIRLYRADEAVFDFDNITGGDKHLAWDREVANSVTSDNVLYQIVDTDKSMGIKYTFGLDLTAIDIPERVADLVYMLPGGDNKDATAWDFLMQLAERVSILSEVRVTVQFDSDLKVDVSKLTIANEYFEMTGKEFNETTNTLTIVCNWIDQTAAIDPATANPICILSGITCVPKEGAKWDAEDQLAICNMGDISYTIYLRANALYAFACNEENQKIYGLTPFDNQDIIIGGSTEKGAYFSDTYATFTDIFVLDRTNRQGWVSNGNHMYYYVDNVAVTGLHRVPSPENPNVMGFYMFEEDGSCSGGYNGLLKYEGKTYFVVGGIPKTGWQTVSNPDRSVVFYYFDPATGAAVNGTQKIDGYTYTFKDDVLVRGQIVTDKNGSRYMWAGSWSSQEWLNIDGKIYYTGQNAYFYTGFRNQYSPEGVWTYYSFAADGHLMTEYTGIYEYEGGLYWLEAGIVDRYPGLVAVNGNLYYIASTNVMVKDRQYWISKANGIVPEGSYYFDKDGKMTIPAGVTVVWPEYNGVAQMPGQQPSVPETPDVPETPETPEGTVKNGFVTENGAIYYYVDGKVCMDGLIYVDGYYYYARTSTGEIITNRTYWATYTNDLMPEGNYTFDAQGRMTNVPANAVKPGDTNKLNGFVTAGDAIYYYVNGKVCMDGLIYVDGYYYYARTSTGEIITDRTYWATYTNDLMAEGNYNFDKQGRMTNVPANAVKPGDDVRNGFVTVDGVIYYYVNGKLCMDGLIYVDGHYYYARTSTGEIVTDRTYWATYTNDLMAEGNYKFDKQGRMTNVPANAVKPGDEVRNGFVTIDGVLYYYVDGKLCMDGLIYVDGYYYYARTSTGEIVTSRKYWVTYTNDLLEEGNYKFDSKGRIVF